MFLSVDGALINTVSFGAGSDVFVAHGGWTGSWEIWQQPFERLSQGRRCVAYDHRGSGETVSDPTSIDADRLVADLLSVLDTLGIEQCILAAESLGGFIALLAVERHPERFNGLVLVSSVYEVTPEATAALVAGSRANYLLTVTEFVEACVPEPDSEHLKRWGRDILGRAEPEAAARLLEGCYGESVNLSKIAIPTLIIHGTEDAIASAGIASHLANEIADAELHLLDGVGHVPTVTRPDRVVEIIEDWIRRRI